MAEEKLVKLNCLPLATWQIALSGTGVQWRKGGTEECRQGISFEPEADGFRIRAGREDLVVPDETMLAVRKNPQDTERFELVHLVSVGDFLPTVDQGWVEIREIVRERKVGRVCIEAVLSEEEILRVSFHPAQPYSPIYFRVRVGVFCLPQFLHKNQGWDYDWDIKVNAGPPVRWYQQKSETPFSLTVARWVAFFQKALSSLKWEEGGFVAQFENYSLRLLQHPQGVVIDVHDGKFKFKSPPLLYGELEHFLDHPQEMWNLLVTLRHYDHRIVPEVLKKYRDGVFRENIAQQLIQEAEAKDYRKIHLTPKTPPEDSSESLVPSPAMTVQIGDEVTQRHTTGLPLDSPVAPGVSKFDSATNTLYIWNGTAWKSTVLV